jgi:hypothetical protein
MSAAEALKAARAARLDLRVDGQDLVLNAPPPPPPIIMDLLARHKAGVIAILRAEDEDWPAYEWRFFYDERAAIAEFDGGLSRRDAEALAHACCVAEWLNRHPVRSSPERCLWCGQAEGSHEPLVPFGTEAAGHAWLHHRCWEDWHARRKTEATDALAAMGIKDRSSKT